MTQLPNNLLSSRKSLYFSLEVLYKHFNITLELKGGSWPAFLAPAFELLCFQLVAK